MRKPEHDALWQAIYAAEFVRQISTPGDGALGLTRGTAHAVELAISYTLPVLIVSGARS